MRSPFDIQIIGRDVSKAAGVERIFSKESGWIEGASVADGIRRQFVWRDSGQPLVMLVGKSLDSIYGPWKSDAFRIVVAIMVLALLAVGVALLLVHEMRMRNLVENQLARQALTDGLTGLSNRRHFDDVLQKEWRRNARAGTSLAILIIDVDHFKMFNDTFGHQAGDRALASIASAISAEMRRSGELAARYGGEEFAVILPASNALDAAAIGERIRARIEKLPLDGTRTTSSIGIASGVPTARGQAVDLVASADVALYRAKASGRNQCCIASQPRSDRAA